MTINNQTTEVSYNWNGNVTDLPITFEIEDPLQVRWAYVDESISSEIIAAVVKDEEDGSGNWVLRVQVGTPGDIRIWRTTPITQETDYQAYDAFPAESHEAALDKLTMICQELYEDKVATEEGDIRYLKLSGGSMTGDIQMTGSRVRTLADPLEDQDAVNKRWYQANQIPGIQGEVGPVGPPPVVTADAESVPHEEGADVTVTPDDPYTGVHMDFKIPAGPTGLTGSTGPKGDPFEYEDFTPEQLDGLTGPEGPVGVTPDFSADVETLEPGEEVTVAVTQTGPPDAHAVNLSFAIPQGEQGLKGEGIDFKGNLPSATDLPASGDADGDAYFIEDEQVIYAWGGATEQWENLGDIRGPQGEQGEKGDTGQDSTVPGPKGDKGDPFTYDDFTPAQLEDLTGPPGQDGQDGMEYRLETDANLRSTPMIKLVDSNDMYSDVAMIAGDGISITSQPSGMRFDVTGGDSYEPPIGIISMWSGNDVRDLTELNSKGWFLCDDGANASGHPNASKVPNLTDRFIKGGMLGVNVGSSGGSSSSSFSGSVDNTNLSTNDTDLGSTDNHTLSTSRMPSHHHSMSTQVAGTTADLNAATGALTVARGSTFPTRDSGDAGSSGAHSHGIGSHSHSIGNHNHSFSGSVDTTPPYYALAYIIYLGVA